MMVDVASVREPLDLDACGVEAFVPGKLVLKESHRYDEILAVNVRYKLTWAMDLFL